MWRQQRQITGRKRGQQKIAAAAWGAVTLHLVLIVSAESAMTETRSDDAPAQPPDIGSQRVGACLCGIRPKRCEGVISESTDSQHQLSNAGEVHVGITMIERAKSSSRQPCVAVRA
jgi:hypothetical protein